MSETTWPISELLELYRSAAPPFKVKPGPRPAQDDAASKRHRSQFERDPELYALAALAVEDAPAQHSRALYRILAASRLGMAPAVGKVHDRVATALMARLPADLVLTVFLGLRQARTNHKHTSRAFVNYLLDHPCLEDIAARRRPSLRDCLEHALGRDVLRGMVRALPGGKPLKGVRDWARAVRVLPRLYQKNDHSVVESPSYKTWHLDRRRDARTSKEFPKTVTATNRGDVSATLVHLYRGGRTAALLEALDGYANQASQGIPRYPGRLALILDASASTRGYGEREFAIISQSVALMMVLQRRVRHLNVHVVGGTGDPPAPAGPTDLASAVLAALGEDPDLVVLISDGYENHMAGDLEFILSGARSAGILTPVVLCQSNFTWKDDLEFRRPSAQLPAIPFWHEDEFPGILFDLFIRASGGRGRAATRDLLMAKLVQMEEDVQ